MVSSILPSREICEFYLERYISSIHPLCPVCYIPTLRSEYLDFWEAFGSDSSAKTLALFLAILYTGASNSDRVDKAHVANILDVYDEILRKINFSSYHISNTVASIQFLQAYIIMNTYRSCQLAPFFAYSFLPQAIRFAQSLRLHVEKKNSSCGVVELEVMRRIWWHLVFLDMESTIATGLPPIIHGKGYTTKLPSLYENNLPCQVRDGTAESPVLSPMMVAMRGHYQWASKMQSWFEKLPSQDEVTGYKEEIEGLISLIPDDISQDSRWAKLYLQMQIDRGHCMLGLRFWQPDQYKGTECNSEVVK